MGDSFERFALILDIFRQVAARVKGGLGRRSEPLRRVDSCLIHGFQGEARSTVLVVQPGEYRGCAVMQCAVWPEIQAALAEGQSMKTIGGWLEEEAGVALSIASLTSYVAACAAGNRDIAKQSPKGYSKQNGARQGWNQLLHEAWLTQNGTTRSRQPWSSCVNPGSISAKCTLTEIRPIRT